MKAGIILLIVYVAGCKPQSESGWKSFVKKVDCNSIESQEFFQSPTVKVDVPYSYLNPDVKHLRCIEQALNLTTLRNGFDSLSVRVWGSDSSAMSPTTQLITFTHNADTNTATFYKLLYFTSNDSLGFHLDSIRVSKNELSEPLSGWESFFDKLTMHGLTSIPDCTKLPDCSFDTDAGGYTIEAATRTMYRQFGYPNSNKQLARMPEAKRFKNLLDFIELEFDLKQVKKNAPHHL